MASQLGDDSAWAGAAANARGTPTATPATTTRAKVRTTADDLRCLPSRAISVSASAPTDPAPIRRVSFSRGITPEMLAGLGMALRALGSYVVGSGPTSSDGTYRNGLGEILNGVTVVTVTTISALRYNL